MQKFKLWVAAFVALLLGLPCAFAQSYTNAVADAMGIVDDAGDVFGSVALLVIAMVAFAVIVRIARKAKG